MLFLTWNLLTEGSQRSESHSESCFGSWFWPYLDFTPCKCKALSNQAFETQRKMDILDRDLPRKPNSEDLSMQTSFGMWIAPFLTGPCTAQILFVIGMAVAMLVNAHSSNHEPNQEADRDLKQLLERYCSFVNRPRIKTLFINITCIWKFTCFELIFKSSNCG